MFNNVLYEPLPDEYKGYKINTDFQIGVQVNIMFDDEELSDEEKSTYFIYLLFGNDDGTVREFPDSEQELEDLTIWFLNGWHHDKKAPGSVEEKRKLVDYFIDQGRIYADFMHNYGININTAKMHWWEFQWLLWNMPHEHSSFKQVIEIRTKKPRKKASAEEIKAIQEGHAIYDLAVRKKQFTKEQKDQIDAYDNMMAAAKAKRIKH